ncbi:MAG: pentapeptide repeat-containing protein [Hormoscilla sp. GM7CHS1pb]|nr:pentapeptide repeat-containing protein [Hormoscilla sp. GM7CHS1pb]
MKASEVLRQYNNGIRDFCGANIRGQSFKGKNLSGADFSGADIRSTNFTNANLRKTKFMRTKAGLQKLWALLLVIASWTISVISGLISGFSVFL